MSFVIQIPVVSPAASKGEENSALLQRVTRSTTKRRMVETPVTKSRDANTDGTVDAREMNQGVELLANPRPERNDHPTSDGVGGDGIAGL